MGISSLNERLALVPGWRARWAFVHDSKGTIALEENLLPSANESVDPRAV